LTVKAKNKTSAYLYYFTRGKWLHSENHLTEHRLKE